MPLHMILKIAECEVYTHFQKLRDYLILKLLKNNKTQPKEDTTEKMKEKCKLIFM